jgi:FkbM family methyltransferase
MLIKWVPMTFLNRQLVIALLGRRAAYRIGRTLYQGARGDVRNDMASNGEMLIQSCVVGAWRKRSAKEHRLVIFDVGANVGDWSAALLGLLVRFDIDSSADVYAFEPVPSTFESLKRRLGNTHSCLHYEQVAMSSACGEAEIYVRCQDAGTNSLHLESADGSEIMVSILKTTVDAFCKTKGIRGIDLLKCDTEGHDMEVIRGALPLLADGKIAVLQFEYNHRWVYARNFLRDAFTAAEKLPYKLAKLQPDHLQIFTTWHPELEQFFEGNYALIRTDALNWFPTKKVSFDRFNALCTGDEPQ